MGRNAGNDKQCLEAKLWRAEAIRLRLDEGLSIRKIAARLDMSPAAVHLALDEARKAVPVENVLALRAQQHEEILDLKAAHKQNALLLDKDSSEVYLKALAREAKLLGLDEPEKKEHTHRELPATREEAIAELKKLATEDPDFARELLEALKSA